MLLKDTAKMIGGKMNLHSGGVGPDDYLFRFGQSKWVKVVIRHGPGMNEEYRMDLKALSIILKMVNQDKGYRDVGTLARQAEKLEKAGQLVTMSASAYLKRVETL